MGQAAVRVADAAVAGAGIGSLWRALFGAEEAPHPTCMSVSVSTTGPDPCQF